MQTKAYFLEIYFQKKILHGILDDFFFSFQAFSIDVQVVYIKSIEKENAYSSASLNLVNKRNIIRGENVHDRRDFICMLR